VAAAAIVDQFEWQGSAAPVAPVAPVPLFRRREQIDGSGARAFSLPGLSAERTAALEQEAFARGYADGTRAAEEASAARLEDRLNRMTASIDAIGALRVVVMHQAERDIVRLAIAIAERIVRRQVDLDPSVLAAIARAAATRLGSRVVATIHLNPADHARIGAGVRGAVELHADPDVPPGGVEVRSAFGTIDAGIEAQVRELSRALLGEAAGEEPTSDGDRAR
jgi:flagellar assembly protein FliH